MSTAASQPAGNVQVTQWRSTQVYDGEIDTRVYGVAEAAGGYRFADGVACRTNRLYTAILGQGRVLFQTFKHDSDDDEVESTAVACTLNPHSRLAKEVTLMSDYKAFADWMAQNVSDILQLADLYRIVLSYTYESPAKFAHNHLMDLFTSKRAKEPDEPLVFDMEEPHQSLSFYLGQLSYSQDASSLIPITGN